MADALTEKLTQAGNTPLADGSTDADSALVSRVQEGDVSAFDILVARHRERLFSIIYNLTSNREDASDLTQDAFIKAFRSIQRFKGKSSFYTWLYRIAINTTYTYLKRNRLRRFFSLENAQDEMSNSEIVETLTAKSKTDKPTMIAELQEKLNDAMQTLSLNHRAVVTLFEIEGMSHSEIAEVMNCSVGTVRSRLHYAKQELQSVLKEYLQ
ncbi:MAG: sigma-70 family RNA polymerase sigma factor [Verrucomicrobiota bacterium]